MSTATTGNVTGNVDAVTFEIIRHKLYQVTDEMVIALENVSGSPITNEGHDMMVALYTPNGNLMAGGVGFLHHLTSAARAVKHVIENFSDDPGIYEDDVYFFNDAYTAALHPPDVYLISPIHHEGTLTGFVANFVHVTDIGAIDPGGFSPNATNNYQEGFQTKGLKIVERGRVRRDVMETFLNMVRDQGMTQLDTKSQLAANHVAKERMRHVYEEYGVDAVSEVSGALIEESERLMRKRLQELPDGEWRVREYIDLPEVTGKVEVTAIKKGDTLTYDFTGTDPQVAYGVNCCYWATWGAMFAPIFPLLAWDMTWNEGVTRPVSMVAPEGTLVNCTRPAPISIATVGIVQVVNNLSTLLLSKMFGASLAYRHRATGVWHGSQAHVETHGTSDDGEFFIAPLTDTFAGSGGARAFRDGVDIGGQVPNVVSRWANVESQELSTPLMYLFRRGVTDSGGPGKFRGGVGHEYGFAPWGTTAEHPLGIVLFGKGTRAPMSLGVFGGYPGCNVGYETYRDTNLADLPGGRESIVSAASETTSWGDFDLEQQDIQYVRFTGGGGYGDPLDRDPELVRSDVSLALVSLECARDIYGVVVDGDGSVDEAATAAQRLQIRQDRTGSTFEPSVVKRQDVPASGRPMGEYLQRADDGTTQCTWCASTVAPADADWKDHAAIRRVPVSAGGPNRPETDEFNLIESFCGSCGTLLEVELARQDEAPLHDRISSWPAAESQGS